MEATTLCVDGRCSFIWVFEDADADAAITKWGTENVLACTAGIILPHHTAWDTKVRILSSGLSIPLQRAICGFADVSNFLMLDPSDDLLTLAYQTETVVSKPGYAFPVMFAQGFDAKAQTTLLSLSLPERDLCAAQAVAKYDRALTVQSDCYNDIIAVVKVEQNATLWTEKRPVIGSKALTNVETMNRLYETLNGNLHCFERIDDYAVNLQFNDPAYRTFYNVEQGDSPNVQLVAVDADAGIFKVQALRVLRAGESLQRSKTNAIPTQVASHVHNKHMTHLATTGVIPVTETVAFVKSWCDQHPMALPYAANLKLPALPEDKGAWKWSTQYDNNAFCGKWAVECGTQMWPESEVLPVLNTINNLEATDLGPAMIQKFAAVVQSLLSNVFNDRGVKTDGQ